MGRVRACTRQEFRAFIMLMHLHAICCLDQSDGSPQPQCRPTKLPAGLASAQECLHAKGGCDDAPVRMLLIPPFPKHSVHAAI